MKFLLSLYLRDLRRSRLRGASVGPQTEEFELTLAGPRYLVRFPAHRLRFCFARLAEARGGMAA